MSIQVVFFDLGDTLVTTTPKAWIPGAQVLLASLKSKGFRLGIISNTGDLTSRTAILNLLPADFDITVFESALVLFSSEIGIEKPQPAIFSNAVQRAGVIANRCLYCSENIVETLVAQHSGMLAIRTQPPPANDLGILEQRIAAFHSQLN